MQSTLEAPVNYNEAGVYNVLWRFVDDELLSIFTVGVCRPDKLQKELRDIVHDCRYRDKSTRNTELLIRTFNFYHANINSLFVFAPLLTAWKFKSIKKTCYQMMGDALSVLQQNNLSAHECDQLAAKCELVMEQLKDLKSDRVNDGRDRYTELRKKCESISKAGLGVMAVIGPLVGISFLTGSPRAFQYLGGLAILVVFFSSLVNATPLVLEVAYDSATTLKNLHSRAALVSNLHQEFEELTTGLQPEPRVVVLDEELDAREHPEDELLLATDSMAGPK